MKFSEQWLREWVNPAISSDELVAQITLAGLEVDDIEAAAGEFSGVVVGEIVSAQQHPDADKLRVCQVSDGTTETQVVCGAPNARVGIKVAFATVGAVLPGNFKIKKAKLRQQESFGMLCSGAELEISEENDGIMELAADAPVGADIRDYLNLNDQIIDVDLTPNRGDCLSIAGLAREVGVLNSVDVQGPELKELAPQIEDVFPVKVSAPEHCPRFLGRVLNNIDATKTSPLWMQEKLRRCGVRSIDPVVDVTNYILLEMGQPMHAYDLNKLNGSIIVRMASQGENLTLLDGQKVELEQETLVIADNEGVLGLAGIMGGADTGVGSGTTNVFLEAAFFNPISIAGKARNYGLHTDASHRFERGVDYDLQRKAMDRATLLLQSIVGGEAGPIVEQVSADHLPTESQVSLRKARLEALLAYKIDDAQVLDILTRLGLTLVASDDASWTFSAPSWRFDMAIEADLIEEVARVYGYNNLPSTNPVASMEIPANAEVQRPLSILRRHMVSRGYQEAITYSMIEPGLLAKFDDQNKPVELVNPISADMAVMRTTLWPGLVKALQHNQNRQQPRIRLFETGQRFIPSDQGLQQQDVFAGLIYGSRNPESWHGKAENVDYFDIKGDLETLLSMGGQNFSFVAIEHLALHPGQSAAIQLDDAVVGYVGAMHPGLVKDLGLQGPVFMFEVDLAAISLGVLPAYQTLSKFPEMRRDLAIVLDQKTSVAEVTGIIESSAGKWLNAVRLFDVYQGQGIENGQKSLALGLTWQHPERTLTDDEVNQWVEQVVTHLAQNAGASLRG
ncbi:MAG TPA: phenylalanine--tRNA ligase subunit beta [Oceanospirillaceae bacterium]|nr:phenylalanine--tRNA ligase subunit beta [Oceanospirillaceae bacterium]